MFQEPEFESPSDEYRWDWMVDSMMENYGVSYDELEAGGQLDELSVLFEESRADYWDGDWYWELLGFIGEEDLIDRYTGEGA